jgi:hypothetical protein
MRCSNCGKDIPFTGKVCPWCHTDKSGDQQKYAFGIAFGIVGGVSGWLIHGIGIALIGVFVGTIVGFIVASKMQSS